MLLQDSNTSEFYNKVIDFGNLIVIGTRGCGKTTLGSSIAKYFNFDYIIDTGAIPSNFMENTLYLVNEDNFKDRPPNSVYFKDLVKFMILNPPYVNKSKEIELNNIKIDYLISALDDIDSGILTSRTKWELLSHLYYKKCKLDS